MPAASTMPLAHRVLRALPWTLAVAGGLSSAAAQERLHVIECTDLMARLAERDGAAASGPRSIDRLEVLLRILVQSLEGQRPSVHTLRDRSMILVRGAEHHQEAAARAVGQLRQLTREARLECTLVTLPLAAAREHGLQEDRVVPADEAAAGAVFKAALRSKGTLQNLPEAKVVSLRPFLVAPPPRAEAAEPRAPAQTDPAQSEPGQSDRAMRVRGEALVLQDEAVLLLQIVRGPLANLATLPRDAVLQMGTVVPRHGGALSMAVQGEQAIVLWVRLADVVDAADAPAPAGAPKK